VFLFIAQCITLNPSSANDTGADEAFRTPTLKSRIKAGLRGVERTTPTTAERTVTGI